MSKRLPQDFTEASLGRVRHKESSFVSSLQIVTVDNLGPLVPVAALRAVLDS